MLFRSSHQFPHIGPDSPHVVSVLQDLIRDYDVRVILFTMRSGSSYYDPEQKKVMNYGRTRENPYPSLLDDAVRWFSDRSIELWGINKNPHQWTWTSSPKPFADMYIDDLGCGAPMTTGQDGTQVVDWLRVKDLVIQKIKERH